MSKKYINADALISDIKQMRNTPNGYSDTFDKSEIIGVIEEQLAADVVEVVRCKDCKLLFSERCPKKSNWPNNYGDYCSYGERKYG